MSAPCLNRWLLAAGLALAATAAGASDPFTPPPPPAPPSNVAVNTPPPPAFDANDAGATYIGTINGVTVYVVPSLGCHLYYEKNRWRDGACLELVRNRLRHPAQ